MKNKRWLFTSIIVFLLMSGCQSERVLPNIRYGEEPCAHCRMLINEANFATAYETNAGEMRKFDDFGCMALQLEEETAVVVWVSDYETQKWLQATDAFFVYSEEIKSPMGDSILAVSTEQRAKALAAQFKGEVLEYEAARDFAKKKRLER